MPNSIDRNAQDRNFYPMLVSLRKSTDDSKQDALQKWSDFNMLPDKYKDLLISEEMSGTIKNIYIEFHLSLEQAGEISRIVRDLLFGKLTEEDLTTYIMNRTNVAEIATAQTISNRLRSSIANFSPHPRPESEVPSVVTITIAFDDALKQYPELGEQLITSDKINLRNFPEPVRPSIKNWLADYTFTIGYDNKDSIKRGNYIFHSQNTLHLSAADRDKLAYVLKTHDDGSEVTVNKNLKKLVFPATAAAPAAPVTAPIKRPNDSPIQNPAYRPLSVEPRRAEATPTRQPAAQFPSRTFPPATGPSPSFKKSENAVPPAVKSVSPQNSASLHGAVRFSSAQKLPFEKINPVKSLPQQPVAEIITQKIQPAPQPAAVNVKPRPVRPAAQAVPDQRSGNVKSSPYIIRPVFSKTEEPKDSLKPLPKNVVNLKDNLLDE